MQSGQCPTTLQLLMSLKINRDEFSETEICV